MKVHLIIIFVALLLTEVNARGYSQGISFSGRNVTLETVFGAIEKQTGYVFFYDDATGSIKVSLTLKDVSIAKALNACVKGHALDYRIENKNIFVTQKQESETALAQATGNQVQPVVITGTVVDSLNREPLIGATVKLRGAATGTVTNANGAFRLTAPPDGELEITYIGYASVRTAINNRTVVNILMGSLTNYQHEVVVTALGIKRATRALNYNVQEIKGDEVTRNRDANFVTSLTGKVAGVTINASSSGIGGATRVVMRGAKSISGNNNALYVIDGVPILNTTDLRTNMPAGQITDIYSASTSSDIISLINPDDIESISTLTGAAAAALYGSQGQNGVVMITTKSGRNAKPSLTLSNSTSFMSPFIMPRFQNTYGQSDEGSYYSWGAKLNKPSAYRPKDFFQTGNNTTTGLTFSTGNDKSQTFLSGAMVQANGIIPNNTLKRYNVSFRNTSKFLDDKLSMDLNTMYVSQTEQNMVAQGLYHNPLVPVYLFPPGGNIETFKSFERYDPSRLFPVQYWPYMGDQFRTENPFWIINREPSVNNTRRLLLGASLKYNVNSWLNVTARGKLDRIDILSTQKRYASTDMLFAGYGGSFNVSENTAEVLYADLLANINKTFGNYTLTANVGGSRTESSSRTIAAGGGIEKGSPPNVFTTDNVSGSTGTGAGAGTARQPDRTSFQSLYATAGLSYKNMLFIDGSYRIDWYSQLYFNPSSRLYLTYPSVGASAILTDVFPIRSRVLSYLKVRGNYSEVGNPPRIYEGGPQVYLLAAGNINQNSPLHYPLQPERTRAWEAGINTRLLDNHINLDVTLYNTNTYNQIFTITQSASGGGNSTFLMNAGKVNNKGIEAALGYNGNVGKVQWESNATFTINNSTVKELYSTKGKDGQTISIDTINIAGGGSYQQKLAVGGNMSAIYTTSRLTQDQNGFISMNPGVSVDNSKYMYAGNADPKYTIGFNNRFSYKNFSLSFLVFARVGGVGVSATQAMLDAYGVSEATARARDLGYVTINNAPYKDVQQFYTQMGSGLNGVLGYYVYSATNVRLRELSFGYTFPGKWLGNAVRSLKVAVTGNNLFMFYNKAPFDPESTPSTGTYFQGIDYFRQPSLRSFGFSVNAQF
ncbi:MAG TPA: SusC/RagA family TonB-linked outer membrane protein [Chitinophaga sp.]|uniref:SusC/RagA family TonB-linked outer membrane protein n=1 Tax=Chitinophaga sp. TaxID=1869181 RepID=UPI002BAFF94A|nr:SusC/RagA family TonB-linked outer membrane protein [Chitinophaga sp.]HVI43931.1 SusC/RagA family TonB-linked outer membrane protein [Chitinophaga sp.]